MKIANCLPAVVTIGLSLLLGATKAVHAADFSFTRIVDTATAIPDGSGNFTDFDYFDLDNGEIAFVGQGANGQQGIYTSSGGTLQRVVDSTTIIPGTSTPFGNTVVFPGFSTPFTTFDGIALSDGNIAFTYLGSTDQPGVFAKIGDSLEVIASTNTPVPGGQGSFVRFSPPDISGDRVVFAGASANSEEGFNRGPLGFPQLDRNPFGFPPGSLNGVYSSSGGTLDVIANRSTPVPGGGDFVFFTEPQIDGDNTAFIGYLSSDLVLSEKAIFANFGEDLERLTPAERGRVAFQQSTVRGLNLSGENAAFFDSGAGRSAPRIVRAVIDGVQTLIFQANSSGNPFSFAQEPSIDGRDVAFAVGIGDFGGPTKTTALYTTLGGSLTEIINSRGSLDGKQLDQFGLSQSLFNQAPALSNGSILFGASFADGSSGLYLAQALTDPTPVPESSSVLGMFALGILGTLLRVIKS